MSDDDLIGKQLGEYRLEAMLGQGGMARVYLATDVRLKRQAVIKVIDPPSHSDPGYMERFEREAQIIGQLDHPNIVRLYRYDEQDGWLYMAMQHIEGADLGVMLENYRAEKTFIEPDEARRVIREICSALDYAHEKGIIHRDVKPANILLDRQGQSFLSDFGLALIVDIGTRGEIFGSAHYMAPEQAVSSAKAVPQSDLYAMGIILYEMFTGDVPFQADRPLDIAFLQITEPPKPPSQLRPDIGPELEAVILKSLAKKPEERYQTGAAFADALDAALDAGSGSGLLGTVPSASRQSIPQRIALALDEQPLPPIPAAVVTSTSSPEPSKEVVTEQPLAAPKSTKPLVYTGLAIGLGIVVLLTLLCLGILFAPAILNGFRTETVPTVDNGIAPEMTATLTVSSKKPGVTARKTGSPTLEISATSTIKPKKTAIPATKTPQVYTLLIVREGNDSLFVVNQSQKAFPLGSLLISDGANSLSGAEWGLTKLKNGECVGAWKQKEDKGKNEDKNKNKMPKDLTCSLVSTIAKDSSTWIGDNAFSISYDGKQVGTCDKKQKQCSVIITIP